MFDTRVGIPLAISVFIYLQQNSSSSSSFECLIIDPTIHRAMLSVDHLFLFLTLSLSVLDPIWIFLGLARSTARQYPVQGHQTPEFFSLSTRKIASFPREPGSLWTRTEASSFICHAHASASLPLLPGQTAPSFLADWTRCPRGCHVYYEPRRLELLTDLPFCLLFPGVSLH